MLYIQKKRINKKINVFFKEKLSVLGNLLIAADQGENLNILKNLTDNKRIDVKNNGVKEYKVHWIGDHVFKNDVKV